MVTDLQDIGSGFIIGFGIQTLVEVSFTASVIGNNAIIYCPYILILIGILSFVMTPVGFYSIILNDNKVMILHMFATFFLASMCGLTTFLGYELNTHVSSLKMENWMKTSIKDDYGHPQAPHVKEDWNKAHQQFKCCGARGMTDFVESKWYIMQKKHPRQRIPESCCASCATMHERFCVAFFKEPGKEEPEKLAQNQTLCLQASNKCLSADTSIAHREVCLHESSDYRLSANAYRHTNGCLEPIRTNLEFFSYRIFIYSICLFILLFVSTITWLVVHEISSPILPFRVQK
uniref:Tetraspanin n=1 Tax=Caenorhabditis japonica TaxID=281687 RepID=A0A8R1DYG5_CAEJA